LRFSRGGRRSIRHSTRCLTASKPITPRAIASLTAASTSSGRNTSSKRRTWTNSRLPGLPMRASSRRRRLSGTLVQELAAFDQDRVVSYFLRQRMFKYVFSIASRRLLVDEFPGLQAPKPTLQFVVGAE